MLNAERNLLESHLISNELQANLREEYESKNYATINNSRPQNLPDSKEYIMDMQLLQQYLDYVRENAQRSGVSDITIKVCMGQYPETLPDARINQGYKGYQTIFFKATNAQNDEALDQVMGLNILSPRPPY